MKNFLRRSLSLSLALSMLCQNIVWAVGPFIPTFEEDLQTGDRRYGPMDGVEGDIIIQAPGDVFLDRFNTNCRLIIETPGYIFFEKPGFAGAGIQAKGNEIVILNEISSNDTLSFHAQTTRNSGIIYTRGMLNTSGKFKNLKAGTVHSKGLSNPLNIFEKNQGSLELEDSIDLEIIKPLLLQGTIQTFGLFTIRGGAFSLKGNVFAQKGSHLELQTFNNYGKLTCLSNGLWVNLSAFNNYGIVDATTIQGQIGELENSTGGVIRTHINFDIKGDAYHNSGKVFTGGIHRMDLKKSCMDEGTFYSPTLCLINAQHVEFVGHHQSFLKDLVVTSPHINVEKHANFEILTQEKYIFQLLSSGTLNFGGRLTHTSSKPFPLHAFFDIAKETQSNLSIFIKAMTCMPLNQWALAKAPLKTSVLLSAQNALQLQGAEVEQDAGNLSLVCNGTVNTNYAKLKAGYFLGNRASIEGQSVKLAYTSLTALFGNAMVTGLLDGQLFETLINGCAIALVQAPTLMLAQSQIRQSNPLKEGQVIVSGNSLSLNHSLLASDQKVVVEGGQNTHVNQSTLLGPLNQISFQGELMLMDSTLKGTENTLNGKVLTIEKTELQGPTEIVGEKSLKTIAVQSNAPLTMVAGEIEFSQSLKAQNLSATGNSIKNNATINVQENVHLKSNDMEQNNRIEGENITLEVAGNYKDSTFSQNVARKNLALLAPQTLGFKGFQEADSLKISLHSMDLLRLLRQSKATFTHAELPFTPVHLTGHTVIDRALTLFAFSFENHGYLKTLKGFTLVLQTYLINKGHIDIAGNGVIKADIVQNYSGTFEASELAIEARQLFCERLVERQYTAHGYQDHLKDPALFKARNGILKILTSQYLEGKGANFEGTAGVDLHSNGQFLLMSAMIEEDVTRVSKKSTHHHHRQTHHKSTIGAPNGFAVVHSDMQTTLIGVDVQALQKIAIGSDGTLNVSNVHDTFAQENTKRRKGHGFKSSKKIATQEFKSTPNPNRFSAIGPVRLFAQKAATIQSPRIQSFGPITLESVQGKLDLPSDKRLHSFSKSRQKKSLHWQSISMSGFVHETLVLPILDTPSSIIISSAHGINLEAPETLTPPWMQALKNDPESTLVRVNETHKKWRKKNQGLTPGGAAVVALAVAAATAGTGSALTAGMSPLMGAMTIAGFQTVAQQTAIALINNQGDPLKSLKSMGSKQSLVTLTTSVATAGLTYGLADHLGVSQTALGFGDHLQRCAIQTGVSTGFTVALNPKDLDHILVQGLVNVAASTSAGYGANQIGDLQLDLVSSGFLHFALGAGFGAASNLENPLKGALGGGIGALTAETIAEVLPSTYDWRTRTDLGRMGGAMAVFLCHQDVNASVLAGTNAVENNYAVHHGMYHHMSDEEKTKEAAVWMEMIGGNLEFLGTPIQFLKDHQTRQMMQTGERIYDTELECLHSSPSFYERAIFGHQMNANLEYMGNLQVFFPTTYGQVGLYLAQGYGSIAAYFANPIKTIWNGAKPIVNQITRDVVRYVKMAKLVPKVPSKPPVPFVRNLKARVYNPKDITNKFFFDTGIEEGEIFVQGTHQIHGDWFLNSEHYFNMVSSSHWNYHKEGPFVFSAHGNNQGVALSKLVPKKEFNFFQMQSLPEKPIEYVSKNVLVDHRAVAKLIKPDPAFKKGQLVVLHSCNGGGPNLPQHLANKLGTPVLAPDGILSTWKNGAMAILNGGEFRLYFPLHNPTKDLSFPSLKPLASLSKETKYPVTLPHFSNPLALKPVNTNYIPFVKRLKRGPYEAQEVTYGYVRISGLYEKSVIRGERRIGAMIDSPLLNLNHGSHHWKFVENGPYVFGTHGAAEGGVFLAKLRIKNPQKQLGLEKPIPNVIFRDIDISTNPTTLEIISGVVNHRALAKVIKKDPNFHKNQMIALVACKGGGPHFPQHLANQLGTPVIAPNKLLWPTSNGSFIIAGQIPGKGIATIDLRNLGDLKIFYPGKLQNIKSH